MQMFDQVMMEVAALSIVMVNWLKNGNQGCIKGKKETNKVDSKLCQNGRGELGMDRNNI